MPDFTAFAATHSAAFRGGHVRAWSAEEFSALCASPFTYVVGDERAFAVGRAVAGEAELLTLATDPSHQRKGLAKAVLKAFHQEALNRAAAFVCLEVAENNRAARALYKSEGYIETARRAAYYRGDCGPAVDALILSRSLP